MERKSFYCIKPRYTHGIPCVVNCDVIKTFIREERDAYRSVLSGKGYDIAETERAQRLGLDRIAVLMHREDESFKVKDLITNKEFKSSNATLPTTDYKPLYVFSLSIINDWEDPEEEASEMILAMRQVSLINDTYGNKIGAEIAIRFLAASKMWKGLIAKVVKEELCCLLMSNIKKIGDETVKAMVPVICKKIK
jgi:hypothetical protein